MKRYEGLVEVDMVFTCPDNDGELGFRRVRILAEHPDGGWIFEDLPSRMNRLALKRLSVCPDLNLRVVFVPEEEAINQEGRT